MNRLYALLVGINRYAHPDVPDLAGCVNDVDDVATLLRTRTGSATTLVPLVLRDEQATVAAVVDGFRSHLAQAGPRDTALFWFSGHGSEAEAPAWAWAAEPSGMLQTLVCTDSRVRGVPDLWDKELSVLLDLVAARARHVAAVLDCCHSGGATRVAGSRWRAVSAGPPRSPDTLLPELRAARVAGSAGAPTHEHVALAACGREQVAEERPFAGRPHGLFTWSLLTAMGRVGTRASYHELLVAAQSEMAQQRARHQVAQAYPAASDLIHQPFLGGEVVRPDAPMVMSYGLDGWQLNAGSAHGLPAEPGLRVGVVGATPVREATVLRVDPGHSLVRPDGAWAPPRDHQFRVVLTSVPMPVTRVAVSGDARAIEQIERAVATAGPVGGPSPHVRTVGHQDVADLTARVVAGLVHVTDREDAPIGAPTDIRDAIGVLEHIARWRLVRELRNPVTHLKNPVEIEIVRAGSATGYAPAAGPVEPVGADGSYHLAYERGPTGWTPPEIFIRLHNRTERTLYCTLLNLTGRCGIHADLFPCAPIGPGCRGAAVRGGRVKVSLPPNVPPTPGCSVTDWLVLLVAERQFSEEPFLLPSLGHPVPRTGRGLPVGGLLERLGGRAVHRDVSAVNPVTAYDWTTRATRLVTEVPG